jgi:peptidoglycan hydrolase-like protein with peptidoglycan-binding domain
MRRVLYMLLLLSLAPDFLLAEKVGGRYESNITLYIQHPICPNIVPIRINLEVKRDKFTGKFVNRNVLNTHYCCSRINNQSFYGTVANGGDISVSLTDDQCGAKSVMMGKIQSELNLVNTYQGEIISINVIKLREIKTSKGLIKVREKKFLPTNIPKIFNQLSLQSRKNVQQFLKRKGLYKYSVDGLYGKKTLAAIILFLKEKNLDPNLDEVKLEIELKNILKSTILNKEQQELTKNSFQKKEYDAILEDNKKSRINKKELFEAKIQNFENSRRKVLISNPGFRNIKPGATFEEIGSEANCYLGATRPQKCYGLNNLKFYGRFKKVTVSSDDNVSESERKEFSILELLKIDIGPLEVSRFLNSLSSSIEKNSENIFTQMRTTLDNKYAWEYEYSDQDLQLFIKGEKEELLVVYEKGQVVIRIFRKNKNYPDDLRLFVEYRDKEIGEKFLEENRPKRATANDF